MKYIGAHVSTKGGLCNAPVNVAAIGANAFALFTKNQRQWLAKSITSAEASDFINECEKHGIAPEYILPHDSYIINLGSVNIELLQKSRESFTGEMQRCEQLGLKMLNFHPGSAVGWADVNQCLDVIAESINVSLAATDHCIAVIENTAGQGNYVGSTFTQLRYIIDRIEQQDRVGVCIDTCHAFAAGYDLKTEDGFRRTWDEFDAVVGFDRLRAMHLNDSMKPLASHVDRHEQLGRGHIGIDCFRMLMQDSRFDNMPLVLETPDPEQWAAEIELLRSFEK